MLYFSVFTWYRYFLSFFLLSQENSTYSIWSHLKRFPLKCFSVPQTIFKSWLLWLSAPCENCYSVIYKANTELTLDLLSLCNKSNKITTLRAHIIKLPVQFSKMKAQREILNVMLLWRQQSTWGNQSRRNFPVSHIILQWIILLYIN